MGYLGALAWFVLAALPCCGVWMLLKTETKDYIKNYHDHDA